MPTGWTSYLHWQSVLVALRGRRADDAPAVERQAEDQPAAPAEPRAALPDRRQRGGSREPAVDGWLDGTPD